MRPPVHAAAVFLALLAVYLLTLPRTLTLEDSGLFIMSCDVAGISHPPGYPLHTLLGRLFTALPVGTVAFRVNLLSAVLGAGTCSVLWWIMRLLAAGPAPAYAAALAYGVSRVFWSQAIIAEVYTLNTFLFFLLLTLCLQAARGATPRRLAALGLAFGLGLANHWPLLLLSAPGLLILLWPRRAEIARKLPLILGGIIVGLLPYVYMVLRSWMDPEISFHGPLQDWRRILGFISRASYGEADASPTAGWEDKLRFLGFLGGQAAGQFTPLGAAAAAVGFLLQWRRWPTRVALTMTWCLLATSALLLLLVSWDFEFLTRAAFQVYPLIPYGVMALWLGLAVGEAAEWLGRRTSWPRERTGAALAGVFAAAALWTNLPYDQRAGYTWARDYAAAVLGALDRDAVLFVTGDVPTGTLGCLHRVEGVRPDVTLHSTRGFVFGNRLFPPWTPEAERARILSAFIAATDRPVYYIGELAHPYGVIEYGLFRKVHRGAPPGAIPVADDRLLTYYESAAAAVTRDLWTHHHRESLLGDCSFLLPLWLHNEKDPARKARLEALSRSVLTSFSALLRRAESLLLLGRLDEALVLARQAERRADEALSKQQRAGLYGLLANILHQSGRTKEVVPCLKTSIAALPFPDRNRSIFHLLQYHAGHKEAVAYFELRKRFYPADAVPPEIAALDERVGSGTR